MIPRAQRQMATRARIRHASSTLRPFSAATISLHPRAITPISLARTGGGGSPNRDEGSDSVQGLPRIKSFFNPGRARKLAASRPSGPGSPPRPEDGSGEGGAGEQPPLPSSFAATYLRQPVSSGRKPFAQPHFVTALKNQLSVSFLPYNQLEKTSDPTIAVISPIEGTEHLVRDTVENAAKALGAEVVRIDAIECLGMRGDGPLGPAGECLKIKDNPVLQGRGVAVTAAEEEVEEDEGEEEEGSEEEHVIHFGQPIEIQLPFGHAGAGQGPRMGAMTPFRTPAERSKIDKLFEDLVNLQPESGPSKLPRSRVIYIKDATAMASTFSQWYPSLLAAVRQRRKSAPATASGPGLFPTTIVLGCNPSLLHEVDADEVGAVEGEQPETPPGMPPALARLLAGARPSTAGQGSSGSNQLWQSCAENDHKGRRHLLQERLKRFKLNDEGQLKSLVPSFGEVESPHPSMPTPAGIIDIGSIIERMRGGATQKSQDVRDKEVVKIWKYLGVLPIERDPAAEIRERQMTRIRLNTLLLKRAIASRGGRLTDDSVADELNKNDESSSDPILRELEELRVLFANCVWVWSAVQNLASLSIGHRLSESREQQAPVISWKTIALAVHAEREGQSRTDLWKAKEMEAPESADIQPKSRKTEKSNVAAEPQKDPVVEAIRNDKKLPAHEKRLLGCIVDANRLLATSFKDVHLPEKTIDGIRSMVTLPLLYPQMFKSGILAQHTTTGALLFGPPGTGKSHLIRALARESGARMLAIQPSDVNDMYVGEGEKLVKAVFSLARKLGPCIVFLDEVDSLFGARSGSGAGGAQAHRQVLTEFMQEMDGLTSASANKNQVIVIGATNRPYDLDEAVLRRLPRRMLVDLPGKKDREAILRILLRDEVLGDDVDLAKIAEQTDTYSGSDLKHLCVQAALAAIKDTITLPWQQSAVDGQQPVVQLPPRKPGPSTSEIVRDEEEEEAELPAAKQSDQLVRSPSAKRGLTVVRHLGEGGEAVDHPMFRDFEREIDAFKAAAARSRGSGGKRSPDREAERFFGLDEAEEFGPKERRKVQEEQEREEEEEEEEDEEEEGEQEQDSEDSAGEPSRVLLMRHFETAMKEITPSSSESGNLPELRKWNAQYGEGGTERGKKSGYGSKFGFGDEQTTAGDADPSYGRVTPEAE